MVSFHDNAWKCINGTCRKHEFKSPYKMLTQLITYLVVSWSSYVWILEMLLFNIQYQIQIFDIGNSPLKPRFSILENVYFLWFPLQLISIISYTTKQNYERKSMYTTTQRILELILLFGDEYLLNIKSVSLSLLLILLFICLMLIKYLWLLYVA